MPIYESESTPFILLRRFEKNKRCICGANLVVFRDFEKSAWGIRCVNVRDHNLMDDRSSVEDKNKSEVAKYMSTAMQKLNPSQALQRVDQARFSKDLTPTDRTLMAQVTREYGLDPVMNELMIYQGNPFVTIGGRLRKAQETGNLDGMGGRPANEEERDARNAGPGDRLYLYEVWVKGCSHPFMGTGRVTQEEINKNIANCMAHDRSPDSLPIVKDPDHHAEKRAKADALKNAFHLPIPSWEEVEGTYAASTGPYIDSTAREVAEDLGMCPVHNKPFKPGKYGPHCTAKVGDGWCKEKPKLKELTPEDLNDILPDDKVSGTPVTTDPKKKNRADWDNVTKAMVPDFTALNKVLFSLCGMQPNEICKELGVGSQRDITITPWDAFLTIKDLKFPKDAPTQ